MFAEVILAKRFPKHMGIFDYQIPPSLIGKVMTGQLVRVPFRHALIEGIILKLKERAIAGKNIKDIAGTIDPLPILTNHQLALAQWIAEYYFVSLGTVVRTMLPDIPKRRAPIDEGSKGVSYLSQRSKRHASKIVRQILKKRGGRFLFWPKTLEEKERIIGELQNLAGIRTLIVVPEINDIAQYTDSLLPDQRRRICVLHSGLSKRAFFESWQAIRQGTAQQVIGTKTALFAPFPSLNLIIVDREENENHKQSEQNPRFDARTVAGKLATLHHANLLYISHAPTVERYYEVMQKELTLVSFEKKTPTSHIHVVDMAEERLKKNFSPLSDTLVHEIQENISQKQAVFLFLNRRGSARSVQCRDCGYVFRCPTCTLPWIYHTQSSKLKAKNFLYCHHCNIRGDVPPFCPKCSGVRFQFSGLGTQKVETEVRKRFPKARTVRVDTDADQVKPESDIIIGTVFALRQIDFRHLRTIGVISADTLLHLPDFRASEWLFQLITQFSFRTKAKIILQTYAPHSRVITAAARHAYEMFYKEELEDRKQFHYPPFSGMIKCIITATEQKTCQSKAKEIVQKLRSAIPEGIEIFTLPPLVPIVRRKWVSHVLIKFPFSMPETTLRTILRMIPDNILIDRDPVGLVS